MRKILSKLFLAGAIAMLTSCYSPAKEDYSDRSISYNIEQPNYSDFQVRLYEKADIPMAIESIKKALKEDGFDIQGYSIKYGTVLAERNSTFKSLTTKLKFWDKERQQLKENIHFEGMLEPVGRQVKVSLKFRKTLYDKQGIIVDEFKIKNTLYYQQFFTKISRIMFDKEYYTPELST